MTVLTRIHQYISPIGLFGIAGLIFAFTQANWVNPSRLLLMFAMLLIVEFFPVRIGKLQMTFSFPLIFAIAVSSGYGVAAILSATALALPQIVRRKPLRTFAFNVSMRVIAVIGAMLAVRFLRLLHPFDLQQHPLSSYLLQLVVAVVVYNAIITLLVMQYMVGRGRSRQNNLLILRMSGLSMIVSLFYNGSMLLMATDPNNTASGLVGFGFFFTPLLAFTIASNLFSNLARNKNGLETLAQVSRSINSQSDMQTVFVQVIREAAQLVQANCGLLFLQKNGRLQRVVCDTDSSTVWMEPLRQLAETVEASGEPVLIHDAEQLMQMRQLTPADPAEGVCRSILAVPIYFDGKVKGVITLGRKESYSFGADDMKFLSIFATHAAVAMKNAVYMEEREKRLIVEERNRLAREIHDGLAQDLTGALLQIEMMKRRPPDNLLDELTKLEHSIRQTVTTVRRSIYSLRPAPYFHVGLVPAVRAHLEEVEQQHHVRTQLAATCMPDALPPHLVRSVFEIVTEAVQNAVKHASARELTVGLQTVTGAEGPLLQLTVRDDGCGFDFGKAILQAANRHSFGLENLYHVAEQSGGTLDILTAPGRGTLVTAEFPLLTVEEELEDDHSSGVV